MKKIMENVYESEHPLIKHKISILRDRSTGTNEFRSITEELGMLLGYEALTDLPLEDVEVETPVAPCMTPMLSGRKPAIVPILRAGLGLVPGLLKLLPSAKVGHIGMYRDETTFEPHEYFCKLPLNIEERLVIVTEPMLATGGSTVDAADLLKARGVKRIKMIVLIAAMEGIERLHEAHPDIELYIAQIDEGLTETKYITPGLGDAGDRIFGTK